MNKAAVQNYSSLIVSMQASFHHTNRGTNKARISPSMIFIYVHLCWPGRLWTAVKCYIVFAVIYIYSGIYTI